MIWNKSKQPADLQQGAAAPQKGGAAAFAKKNWKWLVPVAIVVPAPQYRQHSGNNNAPRPPL